MSVTTNRKTKKPDPLGEHLHLILPRELSERLDKKVEELLSERLGARVTRSDVVRMALHSLLDKKEI